MASNPNNEDNEFDRVLLEEFAFFFASAAEEARKATKEAMNEVTRARSKAKKASKRAAAAAQSGLAEEAKRAAAEAATEVKIAEAKAKEVAEREKKAMAEAKKAKLEAMKAIYRGGRLPKTTLANMPNEVIQLIARPWLDSTASRFAATSTRHKRLVHAPSHRTILDENNGYNTNGSEFFSSAPFGVFQVVQGSKGPKRVFKKNHFRLKEKKRAARELADPNRVPVRRRVGTSPFGTRYSYFSLTTGKPFYKTRRKPEERANPFGYNS